MNSRTRVLLIGLSLTLLLSLSLSPAYAAKPPQTPKGWSGTQVLLVPGTLGTPTYSPGYLVVTISDTEMLVTRGYNFGTIHVDYEIITLETIMIPLSELSKSSINIYDYAHSGHFEWYEGNPYTKTGVIVGSGDFLKDNGPPYGGSLHAALSGGIIVDGIYRVSHWADMTIAGYPIIKMPVELNHAGLYYQNP